MLLLGGLYLGPGFTVSGWLLFVNGPGWREEVTYVPAKTCALGAERLRGRIHSVKRLYLRSCLASNILESAWIVGRQFRDLPIFLECPLCIAKLEVWPSVLCLYQ